MTVRDRLRLFLKVCAAVGYAHQRLIVHRDLKPGNVLVGTDGEPKLLDFGLANALDNADKSAASTRALTPTYASPEQLRGEVITTATDVYSLGVLLFELLTGNLPFPRGRQVEAAGLFVTAPPASKVVVSTTSEEDDSCCERAAQRAATPEALRRQLAGDLDTIVARALQPNSGERFASVAELVVS